QYLFGGTAADSGVELSCTVEPTQFHPKENADLAYGVPPKGKAVNLGTEPSKEQLDPKGAVTIACPESKAAFTQTSKLVATAQVPEAGSGRVTVKSTTVTLHPEKFYLGLKTKAQRAKSGETFQVEGMVVDWQGKLLVSMVNNLEVELVHLDA